MTGVLVKPANDQILESQNHGRSVRAVVVAAVVFAAYLGQVALFWPQINDDAFITFRYSRFLAAGQGAYFNVGEQVEGYTNFLMMLLMAGVIRFLGPDEVLFAAKLAGVAGGAVAICATAALTASWLRATRAADCAWTLGWLAGGLIATNSAFVLNTTTGLETGLFAGWIALGLWLGELTRRSARWCGAGVAFALAGLTRPEGPAAFAAAFGGRLLAGEWRHRAGRLALLLDGAIVTLAFGGQLAFRYLAYDGELVPNTYFAKLGGFANDTAAQYLWRFAWLHLAGAPLLLALLPLLALRRETRAACLPALLVTLYAVAAVVHTGPDWMPAARLLVPYLAGWAALAVLGIAVACERAAPGGRTVRASGRVPLLATTALTLGLTIWQVPTTRAHQLHSDIRAAGYLNGHVALADYLNQHARPGETVALMDIGLVGYHCIQLNVLDITGLTDRFIAKSPGGFLDKQFDLAYLFDRRPEYLVIVLTASVPLEQLADFSQLACWTAIEGRLIDHPAFAAQYVRFRPDDATAAPLDRLAGALGAEKVFQHDYPGAMPYLLVLYHVRRDAAELRDPLEVFRAIRAGQLQYCLVCRTRHAASGRHAP